MDQESKVYSTARIRQILNVRMTAATGGVVGVVGASSTLPFLEISREKFVDVLNKLAAICSFSGTLILGGAAGCVCFTGLGFGGTVLKYAGSPFLLGVANDGNDPSSKSGGDSDTNFDDIDFTLLDPPLSWFE